MVATLDGTDSGVRFRVQWDVSLSTVTLMRRSVCCLDRSGAANHRRPARGVCLLALAVSAIALATPLAARERLDVVLLGNGDRVTGEIINLHSATLVMRTVAAGTVEIDWPDVVGVTSPQLFELELANGRRLVGRFDDGAGPGRLALRAEDGTASEIALAEIVAILQRGATIWRSHRGYLDFGFNLAGGGEDAQLSVGAEFALRGPRIRWSNSGSLSIRNDEEGERQQRRQLQASVELPAGRRWLWLAIGLYERNDDLDLEERETIAGGALWIAVRGARGRVALGGGGAESRERYAGESGGEGVTSGLLMFMADHDRFGPHATNASVSISLLPAVSGPERYRVEVRASLKQKITRDFTFNLSPYYSYDSAPPNSSLPHEDWGLISSIGWLF